MYSRAAARPEHLLTRRRLEQVDRPTPLRVAQPGLQADRDHRRVGRREQVGEARLRHSRAVRAGVEHDPRDELGVVDAGDVAEPVAQPELDHVLRELGVHGLGGRAREALLLGGRVAAPLRERTRRPRRALRLALGGGDPLGELVGDLVDRGVDEGGRAEHDLRGLQLGDLAAHRRQAAEARLVVRHVAGQAALQPQHAAEVLRQQRVRELAAHQHDDGLVAEVLLEALGGLEGLRAAVHERVRRRARLQPQRQRGAAEGQQRGYGQHRQRAARDGRHDACEGVPAHRGQVRGLTRAAARGAGSCRSGRPPGRAASAGRTGARRCGSRCRRRCRSRSA